MCESSLHTEIWPSNFYAIRQSVQFNANGQPMRLSQVAGMATLMNLSTIQRLPAVNFVD